MSFFSYIYKNLLPNKKYISYLRKKGVLIGEDCEIYKTANFGSEPYLISIGNHVRVNAGVQFITHDGGYWVLRDQQSGFGETFKDADYFAEIHIADNVHIGTNVIIMPGVNIGKNSVIACGAVVTHDVVPNTIVGGIPAKPIETLEEYAEKAKGKYIESKHMSQKEKKIFLMRKFEYKENGVANEDRTINISENN